MTIGRFNLARIGLTAAGVMIAAALATPAAASSWEECHDIRFVEEFCTDCTLNMMFDRDCYQCHYDDDLMTVVCEFNYTETIQYMRCDKSCGDYCCCPWWDPYCWIFG